MNQVLGGIAAGGALTVVAGPAQAVQTHTGITDADSGSNRDPAGYGRGGPGSQQEGRGTGRYADNDGSDRTGTTDTDSGANADRPGYGRRARGRLRTGVTDRDSGANRDPAQFGRGGTRPPCTDSDSGQYRDDGGQGRRC
jgi:hypothetical protein